MYLYLIYTILICVTSRHKRRLYEIGDIELNDFVVRVLSKRSREKKSCDGKRVDGTEQKKKPNKYVVEIKCHRQIWPRVGRGGGAWRGGGGVEHNKCFSALSLNLHSSTLETE